MNSSNIVAISIVAMLILVAPLPADEIYTIGNSLTFNARPDFLDGNVSYHIYCSQNLQYIHDNPVGHCVNTSIPWTTALATQQFDFVSVQPFAGTTLVEDTAAISEWMNLQPQATFVIHPAWSSFVDFPFWYQSGRISGTMQPNPEYISDLTAALLARHPGREIRSTKTNDILFSIHLDTQNGIGPLNSISNLGIDAIHMGVSGQYLVHNAMRIAMDQPMSSAGFVVDPTLKTYLDAKLLAIAVPEPSHLPITMAGTGCLIGMVTRRRKKVN